jgi:pSer/pThr/pTyr-binding forkhead associated (FHA) protein
MPTDEENGHGSAKTLIVDTRPAQSHERSVGVLTVVGGLETGRVFAIAAGHEATLGRSEACAFRFDDASVSGIHARIACVAGSHILMDAGSTNGSYSRTAIVSSSGPRPSSAFRL